MSRARLDPTDLRILEHLQRDGRRPYTAIARDLDLSEANVRQRTKRMLRIGMISIVAIADPIELGFGLIGSVGIHARGQGAAVVADAVATFPEVVYLVQCTGSVDMIAEVVCRDHDHLLELTERIARVPGAELGETRIYLRTVKESERWLAQASGLAPLR